MIKFTLGLIEGVGTHQDWLLGGLVIGFIAGYVWWRERAFKARRRHRNSR